MDQPGKEGLPILLVVSWTGKKCFFPCPRSCLRIWARETGSAIRSRVSLLIVTGCTVIWSLHSLRTHSMYVWMDGHHIYSKGKDQPVKVASPARGQLNRKNCFFPCPRLRLKIWSRETGSAVPSRVSLLISILRLNLVADWASTSMVANNNPARGQLDRENEFSPCPRSRLQKFRLSETGSAVPSRAILLILHRAQVENIGCRDKNSTW